MGTVSLDTIFILCGLVFGIVFAIGVTWIAYSNVKNDSAKNGSDGPIPESKPAETVEELIPDSKYLDVDGVKLHYVQAGEGTDVVLLHGIGASVFIWRFLFPILQQRHRVTAIDIAGFGRSAKLAARDYGLDSQADLLTKTVAALGITKAHLVGSSMGGAISLWMAKKSPEIFEKVAVLSPATDARLVSPLVHHLAPIAPFFKPTLTRERMRRLLSNVMTKKELITDDALDRYLEPFERDRTSFRTFIAATSLLSDRRLPGGLAGMRASVLVLWGANDTSVPRRSIDRLMSILPAAKLEIHESASHHMMEDEPVWVARHLEIFFA